MSSDKLEILAYQTFFFEFEFQLSILVNNNITNLIKKIKYQYFNTIFSVLLYT